MSQFTDAFLTANMDKLPGEELPNLRQRLNYLTPQQSNVVLATNLKSPVLALVLSILLGEFGIDRFYIGQIGLGIVKLVSSILLWFVLLGWIWWVVDLFLIMKATRTENLNTLHTSINFATTVGHNG